jgi:hypothetical protein
MDSAALRMSRLIAATLCSVGHKFDLNGTKCAKVSPTTPVYPSKLGLGGAAPPKSGSPWRDSLRKKLRLFPWCKQHTTFPCAFLLNNTVGREVWQKLGSKKT